MRGRNSEVTERKEKKVELLESTVQKIVVRAEMKMDLFGTRIDLEIERERERDRSVCPSVRMYVCSGDPCREADVWTHWQLKQ